MTKRAALAFLTLLVTVTFSGSASAVAAVGGPPPGPGNPPCHSTDPSLSFRDCEQQQNPPPATNTPPPSASPTPTPSPTPTVAKPTTAAEEWGTEVARSIGGIGETMKEAYQRPPVPTWSNASITAYAFTWAIGLVIFAIALVVTVARASRSNPQQRAELRKQAQKLWLYYPVMMVMPALVKWAVDITAGLSEGLVAQSGNSFGTFLGAFAAKMTEDPLSLIVGVLGGSVAALFLLIPVLGAMLMWLVMDITARFGVQLLLLLIPITGALSLFPNSGRRWSARAIGFTLGCLLTPVVMRFSFWVMWLIGGELVTSAANMLHAILIVFVVIAMATAAPMMLAYIMPMLLPQAGAVYGGAGGSIARPAQDLLERASSGLRDVGRSLGGSDSKVSKEAANAAGQEAVSQAQTARAAGTAGQGAATGAAAGSSAAAAGSGSAAGTTAAGAAGGPIGIAAAAALAALQKGAEMTAAASKSAAAMQLQAGGGATNAAESPVSIPLGGRPQGAGGQQQRSSGPGATGGAGRGPEAAATPAFVGDAGSGDAGPSPYAPGDSGGISGDPTGDWVPATGWEPAEWEATASEGHGGDGYDAGADYSPGDTWSQAWGEDYSTDAREVVGPAPVGPQPLLPGPQPAEADPRVVHDQAYGPPRPLGDAQQRPDRWIAPPTSTGVTPMPPARHIPLQQGSPRQQVPRPVGPRPEVQGRPDTSRPEGKGTKK